MFYKKEAENIIRKDTQLENNLESVVALYDNCPSFLKPSIAKGKKLSFGSEMTKEAYFLVYTHRSRQYSESEPINKEWYALNENNCINLEKIKDPVFVDVEDLRKKADPEIIKKNIEKLEYMGFNRLEEEGSFYDKQDSLYHYFIVSNGDPTMSVSPLVCDKIYVYDDKEEMVGYILSKYTDDKIIGLIYSDPENYSSEQEMKIISDNFYECATVDYSRIIPSIQGLGVGKQMYKKMIDYTLRKNICFRPSTNQSTQAENLWLSLRKDYILNENNRIVSTNLKKSKRQKIKV